MERDCYWVYTAKTSTGMDIRKVVVANSFNEAERKIITIKPELEEEFGEIIEKSGYLSFSHSAEDKTEGKLDDILKCLSKLGSVVDDDDEINKVFGTFRVTILTKKGEKWTFDTNFGPKEA